VVLSKLRKKISLAATINCYSQKIKYGDSDVLCFVAVGVGASASNQSSHKIS
jgi:hypothetical protein